MSTNKHAIIRYQTLDRCFSNSGKRYYIEDLLEACNAALFEFDPKSEGIKKRQLYDDIRFMQSSQGFSIPLDKIKDGRRAFYQYQNPSFSINNQPLNATEAEQLKSAMLVLGRFKGLPQFEWVNELLPKLDQTFKLSNHSQEIISFDTNIFLVGTEYITPLFSAIQNNQALELSYQSFKSEHLQIFTFHPYHLKQYNNRWFIFGKREGYNNIINLALDRIQQIQQSSKPYDTSEMVDFEDYFDTIIGVTKPNNTKLMKIELHAKPTLAPYIKTKPIHGSQKKIQDNETGYTFSIEVIPNYELEKLILSLGEDLQVMNPPLLKNTLKTRIEKLYKNY